MDAAAPSQFGFLKGLLHADVNPVTHKSKTLVALNPINKYGRTFHLAWFGFFVAFLSWFAFPPLLHGMLKTDLKLNSAQIGNSNIISLLATLLVRLIAGPLCDKFGPRKVLAGILMAGAIPTACVPAIGYGKTGLTGFYCIRFFVGVLGGTFVPCLVWSTQFFDKSIVGRANGFVGGWGNAGGGVTFFVMPAVAEAFYSNGYSMGHSWRYAFPALPLAVLVLTAAAVFFLGQDTPTGPWATRHIHGVAGTPIDTSAMDKVFSSQAGSSSSSQRVATSPHSHKEKKPITPGEATPDVEIGTIGDYEENVIVENPTIKSAAKILINPQVLFLVLTYMCSFGSELAVEGIISNFYKAQAKSIDKQAWSEQLAGNWSAMFGLLNVITRPLGGYLADKIYLATGNNVNNKRYFHLALGVAQGTFFIWIGLVPGLKVHSLIAAMSFMAIFLEMQNGSAFSIVPHILPQSNGMVSGLVGASGNAGGVIFAVVFRFIAPDYHRAFWIIGCIILSLHLVVCWVPMPRK
ncbi:high affinity nitrate transporter NrtB [Protomyces lactucae-debilis]|uniref:Nitrate/nitrite transporter n=1 Tax=Protomyces lactucae-debilis TaxID=2754530 RepID=A0A1Y2FAY6_PROLT|nr:high affinity nitrate transporter NrtB [Protomyces lactucae-debilis]ORY80025.1 high affinity nitrate transporter NrtB [Protomyces lactucae-debilis]